MPYDLLSVSTNPQDTLSGTQDLSGTVSLTHDILSRTYEVLSGTTHDYDLLSATHDVLSATDGDPLSATMSVSSERIMRNHGSDRMISGNRVLSDTVAGIGTNGTVASSSASISDTGTTLGAERGRMLHSMYGRGSLIRHASPMVQSIEEGSNEDAEIDTYLIQSREEVTESQNDDEEEEGFLEENSQEKASQAQGFLEENYPGQHRDHEQYNSQEQHSPQEHHSGNDDSENADSFMQNGAESRNETENSDSYEEDHGEFRRDESENVVTRNHDESENVVTRSNISATTTRSNIFYYDELFQRHPSLARIQESPIYNQREDPEYLAAHQIQGTDLHPSLARIEESPIYNQREDPEYLAAHQIRRTDLHPSLGRIEESPIYNQREDPEYIAAHQIQRTDPSIVGNVHKLGTVVFSPFGRQWHPTATKGAEGMDPIAARTYGGKGKPGAMGRDTMAEDFRYTRGSDAMYHAKGKDNRAPTMRQPGMTSVREQSGMGSLGGAEQSMAFVPSVREPSVRAASTRETSVRAPSSTREESIRAPSTTTGKPSLRFLASAREESIIRAPSGRRLSREQASMMRARSTRDHSSIRTASTRDPSSVLELSVLPTIPDDDLANDLIDRRSAGARGASSIVDSRDPSSAKPFRPKCVSSVPVSEGKITTPGRDEVCNYCENICGRGQEAVCREVDDLNFYYHKGKCDNCAVCRGPLGDASNSLVVIKVLPNRPLLCHAGECETNFFRNLCRGCGHLIPLDGPRKHGDKAEVFHVECYRCGICAIPFQKDGHYTQSFHRVWQPNKTDEPLKEANTPYMPYLCKECDGQAHEFAESYAAHRPPQKDASGNILPDEDPLARRGDELRRTFKDGVARVCDISRTLPDFVDDGSPDSQNGFRQEMIYISELGDLKARPDAVICKTCGKSLQTMVSDKQLFRKQCIRILQKPQMAREILEGNFECISCEKERRSNPTAKITFDPETDQRFSDMISSGGAGIGPMGGVSEYGEGVGGVGGIDDLSELGGLSGGRDTATTAFQPKVSAMSDVDRRTENLANFRQRQGELGDELVRLFQIQKQLKLQLEQIEIDGRKKMEAGEKQAFKELLKFFPHIMSLYVSEKSNLFRIEEGRTQEINLRAADKEREAEDRNVEDLAGELLLSEEIQRSLIADVNASMDGSKKISARDLLNRAGVAGSPSMRRMEPWNRSGVVSVVQDPAADQHRLTKSGALISDAHIEVLQFQIQSLEELIESKTMFFNVEWPDLLRRFYDMASQERSPEEERILRERGKMLGSNYDPWRDPYASSKIELTTMEVGDLVELKITKKSFKLNLVFPQGSRGIVNSIVINKDNGRKLFGVILELEQGSFYTGNKTGAANKGYKSLVEIERAGGNSALANVDGDSVSSGESYLEFADQAVKRLKNPSKTAICAPLEKDYYLCLTHGVHFPKTVHGELSNPIYSQLQREMLKIGRNKNHRMKMPKKPRMYLIPESWLRKVCSGKMLINTGGSKVEENIFGRRYYEWAKYKLRRRQELELEKSAGNIKEQMKFIEGLGGMGKPTEALARGGFERLDPVLYEAMKERLKAGLPVDPEVMQLVINKLNADLRAAEMDGEDGGNSDGDDADDILGLNRVKKFRKQQAAERAANAPWVDLDAMHNAVEYATTKFTDSAVEKIAELATAKILKMQAFSPLFDANGDPIVDEDGNPIRASKIDRDGRGTVQKRSRKDVLKDVRGKVVIASQKLPQTFISGGDFLDSLKDEVKEEWAVTRDGKEISWKGAKKGRILPKGYNPIDEWLHFEGDWNEDYYKLGWRYQTIHPKKGIPEKEKNDSVGKGNDTNDWSTANDWNNWNTMEESKTGYTGEWGQDYWYEDWDKNDDEYMPSAETQAALTRDDPVVTLEIDDLEGGAVQSAKEGVRQMKEGSHDQKKHHHHHGEGQHHHAKERLGHVEKKSHKEREEPDGTVIIEDIVTRSAGGHKHTRH